MRRTATGFVVVLAAVLASAGAGGASPRGDDDRPVERVLIFSLPHVGWAEVERVDLPNLERFLDRAGIAALSARASPDRRSTRLGDGYITLGAGTRAVGDGVTDGEGFGVDEAFGIDTAGGVFERRTGRSVASGLVQLGVAEIVERNDDVLLGAEPGALGERLDDAGFRRAAIANGDGVDPTGVPPEYRRQAVSALMDEQGILPGGRVDAGLLETDARSPYGLRLDHDGVTAAFELAWVPRSVVLVEASDLVRADTYRAFATPEQGDALVDAALRRADALFGELLEGVDLGRDAVLVVGPAHAEGEATLTVAALRAPGVEPGLLRSATTRRSGFVQLYDVAPTVLDLVGVDRPSSMAGRPFEVGDRSGSTTDRIDYLIDANDAARFVADRVAPLALVIVVAHAVLLGLTLLWLGPLRGATTAQALELGALALLGLIPAVFLARLVPFHDIGAAGYWLFLVVAAVVLAALYRLVGQRTPIDALVAATAIVVALLALDVLLGSRLQINSALGNSPIVAGRFTGFGNLAYSALGSAALALAVLVVTRVGRPRGPWIAAGILAVVVVVDGAPFWGSDVGGVLSLAPAFLVTAGLLFGWSVRLRTAVLAAGATVVAVTGFALLDLARPPERRTHLGRLLEKIGDEGWSSFATVVIRKLEANVGNVANTVWALVVVAAVAFVVTVVVWAPDRLRDLDRVTPAYRAGAIGAAVLLGLGFALNDSGIKVPGVMLTVFDAALVVLIVRSGGLSRSTGGAPARP
ncbi:MAG TPA: hypothetical protein VMQ81_05250 [Acidimicrobiia bacterium]|nr:hypothetical protein [Acidimicrobiia bacterium]